MHQIDGPNFWTHETLGRIFKTLGLTTSTVMTQEFANAIMFEIKGVLDFAGITIRASGAADAEALYASQLQEAILKLVGTYAVNYKDGPGGTDLGGGTAKVYLFMGQFLLYVMPPVFGPGGGVTQYDAYLNDEDTWPAEAFPTTSPAPGANRTFAEVGIVTNSSGSPRVRFDYNWTGYPLRKLTFGNNGDPVGYPQQTFMLMVPKIISTFS